jgi:hypothetical protein
VLIRILDSNISEQLKDDIYEITEELLDLISKYKATRNLLEVKLKHNDDPGRPDFYALIAKLSLLDIIISDLEQLNRILCE